MARDRYGHLGCHRGGELCPCQQLMHVDELVRQAAPGGWRASPQSSSPARLPCRRRRLRGAPRLAAPLEVQAGEAEPRRAPHQISAITGISSKSLALLLDTGLACPDDDVPLPATVEKQCPKSSPEGCFPGSDCVESPPTPDCGGGSAPPSFLSGSRAAAEQIMRMVAPAGSCCSPSSATGGW
mmetsp:Transcript_95894/g.271449  ORF Transcript_95894/g.271449 Transcript_95894/m.271449 type:complete len:183 (-) Transcript_95894:629-1177(-)